MTSGTAPLSVQFAANASDADGDALTYLWSFGDGATSTVANPAHTFTAAGTYGVWLTVSDGQDEATASLTIVVDPAVAPAVCGDGIVDAGEGCDDGNAVDGDGCSAGCVVEGACCSDGPNTVSECFITTPAGCVADGNSALYLGDGTICEADVDCVALIVEYDSWSARATADGVLIRWVTSLEVDTIGFRVLRETATGRREKLLSAVAEMIPAAGNGLTGASYEVLDPKETSVDVLYYYLEDIDVFGRVTRHGPITIESGVRKAPAGRGEATRKRLSLPVRGWR